MREQFVRIARPAAPLQVGRRGIQPVREGGDAARRERRVVGRGAEAVVDPQQDLVAVEADAARGGVRLDVGGNIVTWSIPNEAVAELGRKKGMTAYAVIKASDVMVAVD